MSIGRFIAIAMCLLCVWTVPAVAQSEAPDYSPQVIEAKAQATKALASEVASDISTAISDLEDLTALLQEQVAALPNKIKEADQALQRDKARRTFPAFQSSAVQVNASTSDVDSLIAAREALRALLDAPPAGFATVEIEKMKADLLTLSKAIEAANAVKGDEETKAKYEGQLDTYNKAIKELNALGTKLQSKLNDVTEGVTSKNLYQQLTALIATALVAMVIIGFFVSVFKFETVRANIFSGDNGLQFITLFSIIIAIIIFGLVGVLGTSELSTLLGGLSGYILGRGADKKTAPN